MGASCVILDLSVGGVRETLRRKTYAAAQLNPTARFFLASERSFDPHSFIGFLQSDHEELLFVDTKLNTEIYVEDISTETNHSHLEFERGDDLHKFLHQIGFPEHGVIIKSKGRNDVVFKDLRTSQSVEQPISEAFLLTTEQKIVLMTDMRAHVNPTRLKVIEKVGLKLIETLNSFCPECCSPGFAIRDSIPGLPCEDCGEPSRISKEVLWTCIQFVYTEQKDRPDGVVSIPAAECDYCNP